MTTWPGSMPLTRLSAFSASPAISPFKTYKRCLTWKSFVHQTQTLLAQSNAGSGGPHALFSNRNLAQVRPEPLSELWFTASFPAKKHPTQKDELLSNPAEPGQHGTGRDNKPPDERTLRLGQTLRTLSPLLPNVFATPLPSDILNPRISLHLFPSTHPHLPVVKSRVPCRAALWSAPVAWGCVPIVGNVKVHVISEKMVRTGFVSAPVLTEDGCDEFGEEKLVVRWKTENNKVGDGGTTASIQSLSSSGNEVNRGLSTLLGGSQPLFSRQPAEPFTGLFIFSFDKEGKIASMTIEHADENNGFDKTSRVVTLADWLLGKARWGQVEGGFVPGLAYREAFCKQDHHEKPSWRRKNH